MKALSIRQTSRNQHSARYTVRAIVRDSNNALRVAEFNARVSSSAHASHLTTFVFAETRKLQSIADALNFERIHHFLKIADVELQKVYASCQHKKMIII